MDSTKPMAMLPAKITKPIAPSGLAAVFTATVIPKPMSGVSHDNRASFTFDGSNGLSFGRGPA
jgi:hypothetical protein